DDRLALSNEALKTTGSLRRSAICRSVSAMCRVRSCDSMTHGPRIQSSGCPGPQRWSPIGTGCAVGMSILLVLSVPTRQCGRSARRNQGQSMKGPRLPRLGTGLVDVLELFLPPPPGGGGNSERPCDLA